MTVEKKGNEAAREDNDDGRLSARRRYLFVGLAVALAFFGSYAYASSVRPPSGPALASAGSGDSVGSPQVGAGTDGSGGAGGSAAGVGGAGTNGGPGGGSGAAGGSGCACCGGSGGSSAPIKGKAKLDGGVQKIDVDTSSGGYSPNEITLEAGVPAEITFSPSSGCLGAVIFPDARIQTDLSQGATVKLPAMQKGEYQFYCGMQMVFGKLIVK